MTKDQLKELLNSHFRYVPLDKLDTPISLSDFNQITNHKYKISFRMLNNLNKNDSDGIWQLILDLENEALKPKEIEVKSDINTEVKELPEWLSKIYSK